MLCQGGSASAECCLQFCGAGHSIFHRRNAHLLQRARVPGRCGLVHVAGARGRQQLVALRAPRPVQLRVKPQAIKLAVSGGRRRWQQQQKAAAAAVTSHVGVLLEQHAVAVRAAAMLARESRKVVLSLRAADIIPTPHATSPKTACPYTANTASDSVREHG
eukprot:COSAG02_NODE_4333_length_5492_cov_6.114408_1_plen_161_part_00